MSLFCEPVSAIEAKDSPQERPVLLLGTIPGERPGDFPFFLTIHPDGTLHTAEIGYLTTDWRWDPGTERWIEVGAMRPLVAMAEAAPEDEEEEEL